jgi:hypothetical protein
MPELGEPARYHPRPHWTTLFIGHREPTVPAGVFYTGKIHGGQDRVFLFRGGITNYKIHYSLSWFRPLLEGNSPTSNGLILKMNSGNNEVSRELKKFAK